MQYPLFNKYLDCMQIIEAKEMMVNMNVNVYPNMKNDARKKFYRQVDKIATPIHLRETMDFDEFISKMVPKE